MKDLLYTLLGMLIVAGLIAAFVFAIKMVAVVILLIIIGFCGFVIGQIIRGLIHNE